jgi:hypothetical protein
LEVRLRFAERLPFLDLRLPPFVFGSKAAPAPAPAPAPETKGVTGEVESEGLSVPAPETKGVTGEVESEGLSVPAPES